MRTKVKDTIRRNTIEPQLANAACHHHWLIESACGPTSRGVCKNCGQTRDFFNAIPEPDSTAVKKHVPFTEMPELDIGSQSQSDS